MSSSPLSSFSLRVGITGHRDLGFERERWLGRSVRELLDRLLHADAERSACLLSSLAAGADCLVAEEALRLGYALVAVLPFPRDIYREDFEDNPGALARFDVNLAAASHVIELPGERTDSPAAYREAGRHVVTASDVLLAIWDGQPARGVGGTAEIVDRARRDGVPVAVLWPDRPEDRALLVGDQELPLAELDTIVQGNSPPES